MHLPLPIQVSTASRDSFTGTAPLHTRQQQVASSEDREFHLQAPFLVRLGSQIGKIHHLRMDR